MDFMTPQDIASVIELTGQSAQELARVLGVSRVTLSSWLNGKTAMSEAYAEAFYSYTFSKGIRLNRIKEQLYREDMIQGSELLLFHGAKTMIDGDLRLDQSKHLNDFGDGFYCGESLEQSVMFVASRRQSSLYMLRFAPTGLRCRVFHVDRDWMLTIAYHRGRLEAYKDTAIIKALAAATRDVDYIIAPIADNRMFEIIDSFIEGEITDVQCQHCLSATSLGMQYVFVSEAALSHVTFLERCYLAQPEKDSYLRSRQEGFNVGMDKVKLARKQYRNQGAYIEDILK